MCALPEVLPPISFGLATFFRRSIGSCAHARSCSGAREQKKEQLQHKELNNAFDEGKCVTERLYRCLLSHVLIDLIFLSH